MQSARKVRTSPRTMTRGEPEILRCCPLQSSILALGGKCEENTPEVSAVGFPERYSSVARAGQGRVQSHGNSAGDGRRADVQRPAARYQYARSGGPRKASVRLWTRHDGRNVRVGDRPADVTKVFLTHLHSDHVISLPELYLFPWASQGRNKPLQICGPEGTSAMMKHLQEAFEFDIHIRRDVDEKFPAEGIKSIVTDVQEGVVHEANGAKVTAFLVDHGPVKPAYGFRVDFRGHSVVISGDTKPTENLV